MSHQMVDCDGRILHPGDRVAVQAIHNKDLSVMYVIGFTPHMVKVNKEMLWLSEGALYKQARCVYPQRIAKVFIQD